MKNNEPAVAGRLRALPWKQVTALERSRTRGDRRNEVREVEIVTVDRLPFPHALQFVRNYRKRRRSDAGKWQTETVYAVTGVAAYQAAAQKSRPGHATTGLSRTPSTGPNTSRSPKTPARSGATAPPPS
ncbi:hypothetical protein AB0I54_45670 [Streptomyces sp. NPDC050625]|uniref:hypothetical protein n=1 Tax=Streptomyces sp. NPDC050625 TaxID=3154629 RepID=UPI0034393103